jgi:hypothetical protein
MAAQLGEARGGQIARPPACHPSVECNDNCLEAGSLGSSDKARSKLAIGLARPHRRALLAKPKFTSRARVPRRMISASSGRFASCPCVDPGDRSDEPAAAVEKLVGKISSASWATTAAWSATVGQRVHPPCVRVSLRQDHQRGRRRAGDSCMAVNEQAPCVPRIPAESQNCVDVAFLRQ